jgi:outer membrane protein TolC
VDVLRAEQEVATSRAQLVAGDEAVRQARETLGLALGVTGQYGVAADVNLDDLGRTARQLCREVPTVDTRADILVAKKAVEAAKRDRTTVDYTFLPTVNLLSSLAYSSTVIRSPNFEHVFWTVGAQAKWNIFDGGDRYGQQRQKEAAQTIAQETLIQAHRQAETEAIQTERNILVSQATLEVATGARDIAKESARLSRVAFLNGSGTSFDLVDSAKRLREAEIDLLNKEFGVFQAKIAAFLAKADCSI